MFGMLKKKMYALHIKKSFKLDFGCFANIFFGLLYVFLVPDQVSILCATKNEERTIK